MVAPAQATVTMTVDAAFLRNNDGSLECPVDSVALLVVDRSVNGFADLENGSSLSLYSTTIGGGDDFIIGRWDLSYAGTPGALLSAGVTGLSLSAYGLSQDDPIGLLWFPSLKLTDTTATTGDRYGLYSGVLPSHSGLNGSASWTVPSDGSSISLKFYTTDVEYETGLFGGNPIGVGYATLTVVPEPGEYMALLSLASIGYVGWRRFRSRKH